MSAQARVQLLQDALARVGLRVRRSRGPGWFPYQLVSVTGLDNTKSRPADVLRHDDPTLVELVERYSQLENPLTTHSVWSQNYRKRDLRLRYFRGDNVYVWQRRYLEEPITYYLYGRYVRELDERGLLAHLVEDGDFGCWTYSFATLPNISRDLLDSVNELYFLDRVWGIFDHLPFSVLDIGAGYGRLAHRMVEAVPNVRRYYCADAVPESTYVCGFYTRERGVSEKAWSVPLYCLESTLRGQAVDLAVAVHSLSEMPLTAVIGWIDILDKQGINSLMIVPNAPYDLTSHERTGARLDYSRVLLERGFELKANEPTIMDPDIRHFTGIELQFYFFQR
jgi:hypothetical protein